MPRAAEVLILYGNKITDVNKKNKNLFAFNIDIEEGILQQVERQDRRKREEKGRRKEKKLRK